MAKTEPETEPEILLGRFIRQDLHQAGGMATVYHGYDIQAKVEVAIKRFDRSAHSADIEAEAFQRELEALTDLRHPNIVEILGHGTDNTGKPFLILEWMSHDLFGHKRRGASQFRRWDWFYRDVAWPLLQSLAHTHARGIAHRDCHPGNVLISGEGVVKLADFSISKLKRHLQPRETFNNWGNPPFLPPESNDRSHEFARDVFAFG